jgi:hypothetical protein
LLDVDLAAAINGVSQISEQKFLIELGIMIRIIDTGMKNSPRYLSYSFLEGK